jgi:hypothetical protein
MSKRARYDGPYPAVKVTWPPGRTDVGSEDYKEWVVEVGHQLPEDAPAKLRDELTATDYWTEVDQASSKSEGKGE